MIMISFSRCDTVYVRYCNTLIFQIYNRMPYNDLFERKCVRSLSNVLSTLPTMPQNVPSKSRQEIRPNLQSQQISQISPHMSMKG